MVACIYDPCALTVGWETKMVDSPESQGPASLAHEAVNHKEPLPPQVEVEEQEPKLLSDLHT